MQNPAASSARSLRLGLCLLAAGWAIVAVAGEPSPVSTSTTSAATSTASPTAPVATPTVPLVTQDELLAREAQHRRDLFVLDVRRPDEFAAGHVPGAVNISHDQLASRLAEVPKDKDIVLYCHSGRRAGIAADLLKANGYTRISHLQGDMMAWVDKGRPLEK
jgi:phage shock protein E